MEIAAATPAKKQGKKKGKKVAVSSEDDTESCHSEIVLNDSTEYSEESLGEDDFSGSYPFTEQKPQVRGLLEFIFSTFKVNYFKFS